MIFIDSKQAFEEDLKSGILSKKEGDKNYVGDFMYISLQDIFSKTKNKRLNSM